jgi:hypothetical protein
VEAGGRERREESAPPGVWQGCRCRGRTLADGNDPGERSGLGDVSPEAAGKREASRLRPQREGREPQQSARTEAGAAGRIPAAAGIGALRGVPARMGSARLRLARGERRFPVRTCGAVESIRINTLRRISIPIVERDVSLKELSSPQSINPAAPITALKTATATPVATPAALTAMGIERFWADCAFGSPVQSAGYEVYQVSLATLSDAARDALAATMEHHYLEPATFREGIGGDVLARVLEARLPRREDDRSAKRDRAGDLGELLGIEWLQRHGRGVWDVCCMLRWKESIRPRRGEDIIAIRWNTSPVGLLKGEAKSAASIPGATVAEARDRLDQDGGWPAPFTIDFIAQKLAKDGRENDATRLFDERFKVSPRAGDRGCTHLLFLFSGTDPSARLATHGSPVAGCVHEQFAAVLVCPEYAAIRDGVHKRAIELARERLAS